MDRSYIYSQFNIQQFYVLPTQCIYVFCVDLRTKSHHFAIQHYLIGFCNSDGVFTARYGMNRFQFTLLSIQYVFLCTQ